jgi:two-component system sensor histidine kinase/response regulator
MKDKQEDSSFGSIVLVEEQEEVATLICNILTAAGYQVVWLIDGSTAVGKIKLLQPVAVIMDLRSPGIHGSEISRYLRNSQQTQHIKILILTDREMSQDVQPTMDALADDYLPKPIQPEQLLHKIAALVRSQE